MGNYFCLFRIPNKLPEEGEQEANFQGSARALPISWFTWAVRTFENTELAQNLPTWSFSLYQETTSPLTHRFLHTLKEYVLHRQVAM